MLQNEKSIERWPYTRSILNRPFHFPYYISIIPNIPFMVISFTFVMSCDIYFNYFIYDDTTLDYSQLSLLRPTESKSNRVFQRSPTWPQLVPKLKPQLCLNLWIGDVQIRKFDEVEVEVGVAASWAFESDSWGRFQNPNLNLNLVPQLCIPNSLHWDWSVK